MATFYYGIEMGGHSMEFIGKLPLTARSHDSIFVIVDTLTKSSHFDCVRTTHQAPGISRVYINEILILPDVPKGSYLVEDQCIQNDLD
jgi:hypothetical protein